MKSFLDNSFVMNFFMAIADWISIKWQNSEIGWLVTRNLNDLKIRNSKVYQIISAPFGFMQSITVPDVIQNSSVLKIASNFHFGVYATIFLAPFIPTMACAALIALTFISFFIYKALNRGPEANLDAVGFLFILLILIFGFFAVTSLTPLKSMKIWFLYALFIGFSFLVVRACSSQKRLRIMIATFITAGFFVSLYGIFQQFFGNNEGHAWLDDEMFTEISLRVYSTLENPNVLGEYLLLLIPLCGGMIYACKNLFAKFYYFGVLGISTLCLIYTQSRGCWLGIILAAAIFILLVDRRLVIFGVLAIFALPFVLPQSIIARFTSIGNLTDSSTSYRLYIWLGTLNMLRDFGIWGIGLGSDAYNKIYPFYSYSSIIAPHAHNIYLQLLCETGIIGLSTFITAMLISFKKMLLTFISDNKGLCGIICASVIAGLCGILLQGAFDYIWYNYRVFLIFWMFIGLGLAARKVKG